MAVNAFDDSKNKKEVYTKEEVEELLKEIVLYEDETGTNVDVPLSDNKSNYKEIELFGYRADRSIYAKVETKRKYFTLEDVRWVDNKFHFYTKEYAINENNLKMEYSKLMYIGTDGTSAMGDDADVYITKVIGHK